MQHTAVTSAYYDSFGNVLATTNAAMLDRYAFAAREIDLTGLYHNRARAYNPSTSIFVQQDPIGFEGQDTNLYRYVSNSPILFVDPSGTVAINEVTIKFKTAILIRNGIVCSLFTIGVYAGTKAGLDKLGLGYKNEGGLGTVSQAGAFGVSGIAGAACFTLGLGQGISATTRFRAIHAEDHPIKMILYHLARIVGNAS